MTITEQLRKESVEEYKGYFIQAMKDKFIVAFWYVDQIDNETWNDTVEYLTDDNNKAVQFDDIELAKEAIDIVAYN